MKIMFPKRWRRSHLLCLAMLATPCLAGGDQSGSALNEKVGRNSAGRVVTPVNQAVLPAGQTVDLPGLRPQVLALSPDGRILVVAGKTSEIVVTDPRTGQILKHVPLPSEASQPAAPEAVSSQILRPVVE